MYRPSTESIPSSSQQQFNQQQQQSQQLSQGTSASNNINNSTDNSTTIFDENNLAPSDRRNLLSGLPFGTAGAKGMALLSGKNSSISSGIAGARRNILGEKSANIHQHYQQNFNNQHHHQQSGIPQSTSRLRKDIIYSSTDAKHILPKKRLSSEQSSVLPSVSKEKCRMDNGGVADWDDLDAEDKGDPLMVSEYVNDIFDYMRELEDKFVVKNPDYMKIQTHLNWNSRSILIDWLIEIQWKLNLLPETLFLTVNLIDRFLSLRTVNLLKLQLVGMAATLLASKYEEVLSPSIDNFIVISDKAYSAQELLVAEEYIFQVLNYCLAYGNPIVHLRRISKAENYDVRTRTLSKYMMENMLLSRDFVSCPPSLMAATAIWLSRNILRCGDWNANLRHYSGGYEEEDIKPWASKLISWFKKPLSFEAVFKKYALKRMMKASLYVQNYMKVAYGVSVSVPSPGSTTFD